MSSRNKTRDESWVQVEPGVIYTKKTAPVKAKKRFDILWGGKDGIDRVKVANIKMDNVALFSVTACRPANDMCVILLTLPGISKESRVTDTTACVGGNTVAFAQAFRDVHAIEIDRHRFDMLKHNLRVCSFEKEFLERPIVWEGDCLAICGHSLHNQDIVFVDPPWGGIHYESNRQSVDTLSLSGVPLHRACRTLSSLCKCKYVAVKLPHNMDLDGLLNPDDGPPPKVWHTVNVTNKILFVVLSYE